MPGTDPAMKTTITSGPASLSRARLGTLLWCVLAAVVVLGHLRVTQGPRLENDSYEYLSVADDFLAGLPAYTSIVHFDPELSFGRVPAPLTTFPPGYPAAVGAVAAVTRLPTLWSAFAVSLAAFLLLVPVCAYASRLLGIGVPMAQLLLVWLIGNSWASVYATGVLTESLFTLTSVAAIVLLVAAMEESAATTRAAALAVAAGLLVGVSYWIRYAGVFLFAATLSFTLVRLVLSRDGSSRRAALSVAVAAALIAAGFVRNELLVGTWKGGNTKVVHHALTAVLHQFALWNYHLFLGGIASARFGIAVALVCAGAATAVAAVTVGRRPGTGAWSLRRIILAPPTLLLWYLIVYGAGMIYLGTSSVISFDTRMFYPVLPVMLLLTAWAWQALLAGLPAGSARPVAAYSGLAVATLAYLLVNGRSYFTPMPVSADRIVARELGPERPSDTSLRSWLESHVTPDDTMVANRGQASAYVLQRKTIALVSSEYSDRRWDERSVRGLMRTHDANFIVVYSGDGGDDVLRESSFLQSLARLAAPKWLELVAHNRDAAVFRLVPGAALLGELPAADRTSINAE